MKEISLYVPKLDDYWYEEKLLSDPETMEYNAGYDVSYNGYDYQTGCIAFPKDNWLAKFENRKNNKEYFAYIKDTNIDDFVGYVYYHYNKELNHYDCGILMEAQYRGQGYAKHALKLLCKTAKRNGISELYDNFETKRRAALKLFESARFKIIKVLTWKKFNKDVSGVIMRVKL